MALSGEASALSPIAASGPPFGDGSAPPGAGAGPASRGTRGVRGDGRGSDVAGSVLASPPADVGTDVRRAITAFGSAVLGSAFTSPSVLQATPPVTQSIVIASA